MNIYWCGGEDIDFPGALIEMSYGDCRTGYARASLKSPAIRNSLPFAAGELTSAFASAYMYIENGIDNKFFGLVKNGSGGKGIYFGTGSSYSKAAIWKYDGSTWTNLASETGASLPWRNVSQSHFILQIINYGASATVKAFLGGTELVSYTGDISIAGVTGFDAYGFGGSYSNWSMFFSELIVSDEHPSTLSLVTHYPSAAGDANAWTGTYADIDEISNSDADAIYVNSADQDTQLGLSNTPTGTFAVDAIKVVARACKTGDASVGTLKLGVKSGGTIDVDAGHTLSTSWESFERLTATINGSQITTAILDANQLNLRSAT
jgi:hypothetical protein